MTEINSDLWAYAKRQKKFSWQNPKIVTPEGTWFAPVTIDQARVFLTSYWVPANLRLHNSTWVEVELGYTLTRIRRGDVLLFDDTYTKIFMVSREHLEVHATLARRASK